MPRCGVREKTFFVDALPNVKILLRGESVRLKDLFLRHRGGVLFGGPELPPLRGASRIDLSRLDQLLEFEASLVQLRAYGLRFFACLYPNDPYILKAWAKARGVSESILFISDNSYRLSDMLGLTHWRPPAPSLQRFVILTDVSGRVAWSAFGDDARAAELLAYLARSTVPPLHCNIPSYDNYTVGIPNCSHPRDIGHRHSHQHNDLRNCCYDDPLTSKSCMCTGLSSRCFGCRPCVHSHYNLDLSCAHNSAGIAFPLGVEGPTTTELGRRSCQATAIQNSPTQPSESRMYYYEEMLRNRLAGSPITAYCPPTSVAPPPPPPPPPPPAPHLTLRRNSSQRSAVANRLKEFRHAHSGSITTLPVPQIPARRRASVSPVIKSEPIMSIAEPQSSIDPETVDMPTEDLYVSSCSGDDDHVPTVSEDGNADSEDCDEDETDSDEDDDDLDDDGDEVVSEDAAFLNTSVFYKWRGLTLDASVRTDLLLTKNLKRVYLSENDDADDAQLPPIGSRPSPNISDSLADLPLNIPSPHNRLSVASSSTTSSPEVANGLVNTCQLRLRYAKPAASHCVHEIAYTPKQLRVSIDLRSYADGFGKIVYNQQEYTAFEFHVVGPSPHHLDQTDTFRRPVEIRILHTSKCVQVDRPQLVVLAATFKPPCLTATERENVVASNSFMNAILNIPTISPGTFEVFHAAPKALYDGGFDLQKVVSPDCGYIVYNGVLSSMNEKVTWCVQINPLLISRRQLAAISAFLYHEEEHIRRAEDAYSLAYVFRYIPKVANLKSQSSSALVDYIVKKTRLISRIMGAICKSAMSNCSIEDRSQLAKWLKALLQALKEQEAETADLKQLLVRALSVFKVDDQEMVAGLRDPVTGEPRSRYLWEFLPDEQALNLLEQLTKNPDGKHVMGKSTISTANDRMFFTRSNTFQAEMSGRYQNTTLTTDDDTSWSRPEGSEDKGVQQKERSAHSADCDGECAVTSETSLRRSSSGRSSSSYSGSSSCTCSSCEREQRGAFRPRTSGKATGAGQRDNVASRKPPSSTKQRPTGRPVAAKTTQSASRVVAPPASLPAVIAKPKKAPVQQRPKPPEKSALKRRRSPNSSSGSRLANSQQSSSDARSRSRSLSSSCSCEECLVEVEHQASDEESSDYYSDSLSDCSCSDSDCSVRRRKQQRKHLARIATMKAKAKANAKAKVAKRQAPPPAKPVKQAPRTKAVEPTSTAPRKLKAASGARRAAEEAVTPPPQKPGKAFAQTTTPPTTHSVKALAKPQRPPPKKEPIKAQRIVRANSGSSYSSSASYVTNSSSSGSWSSSGSCDSACSCDRRRPAPVKTPAVKKKVVAVPARTALYGKRPKTAPRGSGSSAAREDLAVTRQQPVLAGGGLSSGSKQARRDEVTTKKRKSAPVIKTDLMGTSSSDTDTMPKPRRNTTIMSGTSNEDKQELVNFMLHQLKRTEQDSFKHDEVTSGNTHANTTKLSPGDIYALYKSQKESVKHMPTKRAAGITFAAKPSIMTSEEDEKDDWFDRRSSRELRLRSRKPTAHPMTVQTARQESEADASPAPPATTHSPEPQPPPTTAPQPPATGQYGRQRGRIMSMKTPALEPGRVLTELGIV